ncbi:hypothetical protein O6H91_01G132100 [Diphasiastrum complanatum]|uniref:Uncharacterized protein n=1 Tax=Diphasiastrum complanatum TaxID=34168 RepID=A0ACC2EW78_DIPCM|nr:hypothetical protein O6H91_01G132100 [Diphasiastrum complanatum]
MWQSWEIAPSLLSQNGLLHPDPAKAGDQPDQAFRAMEDVQMKDEEEELSKDDLFKAAESGRVEVFETLSHRQLSRLCALRNEDDRTLLHVAAAAGHSSVVKLIASNIDISKGGANESDEEGWTPLQSAVSSGHADVVTALLQSGADVQKSNKGGRTPLHYAASKGRIEIAHTLILHGAKVNQKDKVSLSLSLSLTHTHTHTHTHTRTSYTQYITTCSS